MNKSSIVKILKYILSLIFAFGIIYLLFKNQDPIQLIEEIKRVNIEWVVLSMIFGGWAIVNRGLRWIVLIDALGYKSSKSNAIGAVAILYFTNLFIPRGGEITRCTSMNQVEKIPIEKLFGTIIIERIIDFVFLFGLMFIAIILKFDDILKFYTAIQNQQPEGTSGQNYTLIVIAISTIIICLFFLKKLIKKSNIYIKILSFIDGIKEGVNSIKNMKKKSVFWFHTCSIWIMYFLMTYVCFFSITETSNLTLVDGVFLLVIGGIGMVIPTPGGIGSYHAIVMIGLSVLGIGTASFGGSSDSSNPALLFPTIIHAGQTLMVIIMGLIGMLVLFLSKKNNHVKS